MCFRNFVKFFIVLWACSTTLRAEEPPSKRVDPWEVTQKYCGQLLQASIKIVCKGRSQRSNLIFSSTYNETNCKTICSYG